MDQKALTEFLPSATKLRRLCFYTCLLVILFTGGGLPQYMLGYHTSQDQAPPSPRTRHPPEQTPPGPGALPPGADTTASPQDQATPIPPADGHYCRRYASYWNAFLFLNVFTQFTEFGENIYN